MRLLRCVLLVSAMLVPASQAGAVVVNKIVTFSANTFFTFDNNNPGAGNQLGIASTDPVNGGFSITFDSASDHTNVTAGISATSINLAVGSAWAFIYESTSDTLRIGGLQSGANVVTFSPPTNDFWLFINNFTSGAPTFGQVGYAQVADGPKINFTQNQTGAVSVRDAPPQVPVPAALPLMAGGLALLGLAGLRRKRR